LFLDKNKPSYIGGILEMGNNRLYRFWGDLEEALLTGLPQNEVKNGNMNFLLNSINHRKNWKSLWMRCQEFK